MPPSDMLRGLLRVERADGSSVTTPPAELWSMPAEVEPGEPLPWAGMKTVFVVDDENEERVVGTLARSSEQLLPDEWKTTGGGGSAPPVVQAGQLTIGLKALTRVPVTESATDFDIWLTCRPPPPALHVRLGLRSSGVLEAEVVGARNLPADNSFDMADPYALLELGPVKVRGLPAGELARPPVRLKTKAVDNTLSPSWAQSLEFVETAGFGPPEEMVMYYESPAGETESTTLAELREATTAGTLTAASQIWWPALGHDEGVLRWQTVEAAEPELGLLGSTVGQLLITVLDKDLLSADDMICNFGPLMLADIPRVADGEPLIDHRLEAAASCRLGQRWTKTVQRAQAEVVSVESLTAQENLRTEALSAFNEADVDGNGLLDQDELMQVASWLPDGEGMTTADVATAVEQLDVDGSREVDFEAFFLWWEQRAKSKAH